MPINAILDLSHHNGDIDLEPAAAAGILGVIHKATQGWQFEDLTTPTKLKRSKPGSFGAHTILVWVPTEFHKPSFF